MGVNYLLSQPISNNQKIILVNPLVKKRKLINLFIRDIKFLLKEGTYWNRIVPISSWFFAIRRVIQLIKVSVLENLLKLPKENVVIIRGIRDKYFCDLENVELIKREGFTLFEVDAGHNWNENIARKVKEVIYE